MQQQISKGLITFQGELVLAHELNLLSRVKQCTIKLVLYFLCLLAKKNWIVCLVVA